jgi:hypothetical protein
MLSALTVSLDHNRFGYIVRLNVEFARPAAQRLAAELAKVLGCPLVGTAALAGGFHRFGACSDIDPELPRQLLQAGGDIHGIADHRIFEALFPADISDYDGFLMNAHNHSDRLLATSLAFGRPFADRRNHGVSAGEGIGCIMGSRMRCSERRHQAIAEIFIEGARIAEDAEYQEDDISSRAPPSWCFLQIARHR